MQFVIAVNMLTVFGGMGIAHDFPRRPVRIVVLYLPGGPTDIPARAITPLLAGVLDQSVLVDNRSGAGGIIGAELVRWAGAVKASSARVD